jgi:hypothetical protein
MECNIKNGGNGLLEPSLKYVYDTEIDSKTVLQPADSEVEEFRLMTALEVKKNILVGNYKLMCLMVLVDFFIRHGSLTTENEKGYADLVVRTYRYLFFPTSSL